MTALFFGPTRFPLGALFITPGAEAWLTLSDLSTALTIHGSNAGAESDEEGFAENPHLRRSVFQAASGAAFWVVTNMTAPVTAVLLPEEFHQRSCAEMSPTEVAALLS